MVVLLVLWSLLLLLLLLFFMLLLSVPDVLPVLSPPLPNSSPCIGTMETPTKVVPPPPPPPSPVPCPLSLCHRYASVFPEVPPLLASLVSADALRRSRGAGGALVLNRAEIVEVLLEAARQVSVFNVYI